ncbi:uncharacterized protein LOC134280846 [Saccostrea cucullata]|uniref:uncharacterized protein LOC134280846 n=1 Tax=Saccostrea cuccullata TaxID=36930 RepID=UPI002ED260F2
MYFIMDECDSPGQFRCDALVKVPRTNGFAGHAIYAYFNADKAQNGGVSSKCDTRKKNEDEEKQYLQLLDTLPDLYLESARLSYIGSVSEKDAKQRSTKSTGGYTKITEKYEEIKGLRYTKLQCKVDTKKIKAKIIRVAEFYFFYQPLDDWPNARMILAGLVKKKALFVHPYRFRMFPQFRILLDKKKHPAWDGRTGSENLAYFSITIPMDLCDTLTGTFQCQAKVLATGFLEHKSASLVTGWYKLDHSHLSKKSKNCGKKRRTKS